MSSDALFRFEVLITDPDWYRFLRARPLLDEVNFWQPGRSSNSTAPGTPWLYLIRGTSSIWGMGYFAAFSRMPIGVAWDTFGEGNGFDSFLAFQTKIARLKGVSPNAVGDIGCSVLSSPTYFDEPIEFSHFARMYGPSKPFDARAPDGAKLWGLVEDQRNRGLTPIATSPFLKQPASGKPVLVIPRLGQATFRIQLEQQYDTRCTVTGERTRPTLEAAHIKPFSMVREHSLNNGLLLRSDLHKLFDQGYVTITPDRKFRVSKAIREEFENGRDYYALDGLSIRQPRSENAQPAEECLDWHSSVKFKG